MAFYFIFSSFFVDCSSGFLSLCACWLPFWIFLLRHLVTLETPRVSGGLCPAGCQLQSLGSHGTATLHFFMLGGSFSSEGCQLRGDGDLRKSEEGPSDHLERGVREAVRSALE